MKRFRIFSALVVIVTVVLAKVPNKNCHCFDKNKSQKQECPFGKLRNVVSSLSVAASFSLSEFITTTYKSEGLSVENIYSSLVVTLKRVRDPPFFSL